MKKVTGLIIAGLLLLPTGLLWAATTFTISAVIPTATSVNITAASVPAAGGTFTAITGSTLAFGTMTFDSTVPAGGTTAPNIWRAPNYFAIDVANNGAGAPNVTVTYAEGSKPTNQTNGLGYKGTMDFKKVTGSGTTTTDNVLAAHSKKALKDVANEHITPAELAGGWLRLYIGLADGSTGAPGEAFTNADQPGTYTGTVTITATVS